MNQAFSQLEKYFQRLKALKMTLNLWNWDDATQAPEQAGNHRDEAIGTLSSIVYDIYADPQYGQLLQQVDFFEGSTPLEKKMAQTELLELEYMTAIPAQEYEDYTKACAKVTRSWTQAKKNGDFSQFLPNLRQIVEYTKKMGKYRANNGQELYDVLLSQFEPGFSMRELDPFFATLKKELVPLLKKVISKQKDVSREMLEQPFELEKQKEFCRFISQYVGFDFSRGEMGESPHPFTTEFHNQDVRFTTAYSLNHPENAIFSTIHESGHGIYEQGVAEEITMTPLGVGTSMGIHESQSRLYENMIGRSEAFWKPIYKKLQETFPTQLGNIPCEQFLAAINKVSPGPVRTEADELTYSIHILIRYEIEKKIFQENYPLEKLPKLWKRMYKEYLGVEVPDDTRGVLQDIHWAMGSFGYFPSYALGNAMAAQIYHAMEEEIPVESCLEAGELGKIREYLNYHIHRFGKEKNAREILRETTGEDFTPRYYVEYLKKKYAV